MRMLRRALVLALALPALPALAACSSPSSDGGTKSAGPNDPLARTGEIHGADTWADGTVLNGTVTIAKDGNVEIAPGAKITVAEGATLYVAGVLRAKAAAKHAKITSTKWAGLVVSGGGKADLEGVDLENGLVGIATAEGALDSTLSESIISNSLKPFVVSKASKLTVTNVKASTPEKIGPSDLSESDISGILVASRLDYDAHNYEGVSVREGGEIDLSDSTFHGKNAADLLSAYGAKHLKVAYSTFTGAHCGLHIQPSESFEIDHVTSDTDIYGITIYGSGAGPNTVKNSNFTGSAAWLDFQGFDQGKVTFENVYTSGSEVLTGTPTPTVTGKVTAPIPDAKPR
jgi:hypothetical protein